MKKLLQEGAYHEIGHYLAAKNLFPHRVIVGIEFAKKDNRSYGFALSYANDIGYNYRTENFSDFTILSLGGGIFQKMKEISEGIDISGLAPTELVELFMNNINLTDDNIEKRGMVDDYAILRVIHEKLQEKEIISFSFDIEKSKEITIKYFIPFLNNRNIDSLCDIICQKCEDCGIKRKDKVLFDSVTIQQYI